MGRAYSGYVALIQPRLKTWVNINHSFLACFNWRFPNCISPQFQSESKCEAFRVEIYFIQTQMLVNLHVNKTNFPYERLRTRTRFETEAKCNSEMAYSLNSD